MAEFHLAASVSECSYCRLANTLPSLTPRAEKSEITVNTICNTCALAVKSRLTSGNSTQLPTTNHASNHNHKDFCAAVNLLTFTKSAVTCLKLGLCFTRMLDTGNITSQTATFDKNGWKANLQ